DGSIETWRGEVEGTLVWPPRGTEGFGYDPMFLPAGHDKTFGEMLAEAKHGWDGKGEGLSHRARAFAKFARARLRA
ncbi:MAG: non-canonical purine NTP pyrophosphatase, partial [Bauldia sp.]